MKAGILAQGGTAEPVRWARLEMTAVAAHRDPATDHLMLANCGHVAPVVIRDDGTVDRFAFGSGHGLGGRATPKPDRRSTTLASGDRLVLVSDGVVECGA